MRLMTVLNLLVCSATLVMLIFLLPKKEDNSFLAGIKPSTKSVKAVASQEIDYSTAGIFMEKFRDTLSDELGVNYRGIHTGGVRFMLEDIKAYIYSIYDKARLRGLSDDSIRNLSLYICPGVYPKQYSHPTLGIPVSDRLTCFIFVPLKGKGIFNSTTRKLDIPQNMFLTAYDWGSLEP
jgi:hypothetical protein